MALHRKLVAGNFRRISRATGYSHQHVSQVLKGLSGFNYEFAKRVCAACGISLSEFDDHIETARANARDVLEKAKADGSYSKEYTGKRFERFRKSRSKRPPVEPINPAQPTADQ